MNQQIKLPGMEEFFRPDRVSRPAMALLHRLHAIQERCSWVGPKVATLCTWFGKSRATVLRWIAELKNAGYLTVTRRGRTSALFFVKSIPRSETSKASYPLTESSNILSSARSAKTTPKKPKQTMRQFVEEIWDTLGETAEQSVARILGRAA